MTVSPALTALARVKVAVLAVALISTLFTIRGAPFTLTVKSVVAGIFVLSSGLASLSVINSRSPLTVALPNTGAVLSPVTLVTV